MKRPRITIAAVVTLFLTINNLALAQDVLDKTIQSKLQAQDDARSSQNRIDNLADETRNLLGKYRFAIRQTDSLKAYNSQIRRNIDNQKELLISIQRQLENIDETKRSIMPLLSRMVRVLEQTVAVDTPFLTQERKLRVDSMKQMMDQPDISVPEKYRRIMEAYQIEVEYGRTIESYSDEIEIEGNKQTVNVLRVGRIALVYQSLDEAETGFWDSATKSWRPLPGEYNLSIKQGIQVARKQTPPDLFNIPIRTPGGAK